MFEMTNPINSSLNREIMNSINAQPNILLANHCSFSLTAMQINFETLNLRKNLVSMKDAQQVIVYVKIMLG